MPRPSRSGDVAPSDPRYNLLNSDSAHRQVSNGEAGRQRRSLNHALGAFLDLAAGRGVEGALDTAAAAGGGWAFGENRQAPYRAKTN